MIHINGVYSLEAFPFNFDLFEFQEAFSFSGLEGVSPFPAEIPPCQIAWPFARTNPASPLPFLRQDIEPHQ